MVVEIAPDGDLLITLTTPTQPFAPWPGPDDADEDNTHLDVDDEEPDGSSASDTSDAYWTDEDQFSEPDVTRFRVSSTNMCSASRRFRQMLTGPWIEATTTHPDGLRHVDMEGFDPEAFEIILKLIHGLIFKVVGAAVDFELLARICVVIDDLECHRQEDVYTMTGMWTTCLGHNHRSFARLTELFDRDLMLSIFISSVLDLPDLFKASTCTAIERSPGHIPTLGLPIRDKIVDAILERRTVLLGLIVDELHRELTCRDRPHLCRPSCPSVCESVRLDGLLTAMVDCKVYPRPCPPFTGICLHDLVCSLHDLACMTGEIRTPMLFYKDNGGGDLACCLGAVEDLPILDGIRFDSTGLDLEKILPIR